MRIVVGIGELDVRDTLVIEVLAIQVANLRNRWDAVVDVRWIAGLSAALLRGNKKRTANGSKAHGG